MQVTKASVGHPVLPWGTEKQQLDIRSFIFSLHRVIQIPTPGPFPVQSPRLRFEWVIIT